MAGLAEKTGIELALILIFGNAVFSRIFVDVWHRYIYNGWYVKYL